MIKKLRLKFIAVAMCSVFIVVLGMIGIINIVNYVNITNSADNLVELLKNKNGYFDSDRGENFEMRPPKPNLSKIPFETRFFTVEINDDKQKIIVNIDQIASVNESEAIDYAINVSKKNSEKGFYGEYRYGVFATSSESKIYIFLDCTRELDSFHDFLWISIIVSIVGFAIVFLLVYFLSGKIMKPIIESYAKQKRFITDASHDIKTPLTIISADTEILEMQDGENEWTQSIKSEIKKLTSLTEKLVFLAKMSEDTQVLKEIDFSISDAVEEIAKSFEPVALSHNTPIICDIQKNVTYCGDESMIRQLISLLIDNAVKYSDRNEEINVALFAVSSKIHLIITNKNSELHEENMTNLFERFYRSDQSRNSETGGHGIGLSVAKSIVMAHKGKIFAKCSDGIVTFTTIL